MNQILQAMINMLFSIIVRLLDLFAKRECAKHLWCCKKCPYWNPPAEICMLGALQYRLIPMYLEKNWVNCDILDSSNETDENYEKIRAYDRAKRNKNGHIR